MRIQFEFEITKLPLQYRLGILSIIKEMIKSGSKEYYQQKFETNSSKMKSFTHGTFIKNINIKNNEIYGERLILTISSPSYEFIMHLMNGSQRSEVYRYKGYVFTLKKKRLLPKPPEFTNLVTFRTVSPLLIENRNGRPILVNDTEFEKEFNYYANLATNEYFQRNLFEPIQIVNSSMKKVVIKEKLHQIDNNNIFITGNQGIIKLQGHPDDLKFIYEYGIGRRRSLGFGLLEVKEVDY